MIEAVAEAVEAGAISEAVTETVAEPKEPKLDKLGRAYATGRRKDASARVWIKKGTGKVTVNKKELKAYFARPVLEMLINQPLEAVEMVGKFDIYATVSGGGLSGQAGAVRHAISRALANFNPVAFHKTLRKGGFLTRDSRVVERKKYGQKKARKRFQFSKR